MQLDNIEEARNTFVDFKSFFIEIYDTKKELEDELVLKDNETVDYLHELELGDLNAIELMKTVKRLINGRTERRIIKDKLELIKTEKGFVDTYIVKGIVNELDRAIENIDTLKKYQVNRKYTPKVVKDLKCAKK